MAYESIPHRGSLSNTNKSLTDKNQKCRYQYPFKLRFQKNVFSKKIAFDGKKFGNTKN